MLSAVLLLDDNGDVIVMRKFRDDFDPISVDNYRVRVIAAKDMSLPAELIDNTSFLHYYENEIYYVAVTRQNANSCAIFEFLTRLPKIFAQVLDLKEVTPTEIKGVIPDIIELLDEMVDCGYLQNTDPETLRLLTFGQSSSATSPNAETQVTIMATGAISWRPPNIVYRQNEIFVDIIEKVSLLISATGQVRDSSVNGTIIMRSCLSGMPECKIGFNEKVTTDSEGGRAGVMGSSEVDDMVFHQCVRLNDFAKDHAISFTPPDGEFELMRYRKTKNVGEPFSITPHVRDVQPKGGSTALHLEIRVLCRASYDTKLAATNVILTIPLPQNTAEVSLTHSTGRGKYVQEINAVVWKCERFVGGTQVEIIINVRCLEAISRTHPVKQLTEPITADFNISMFSASGLMLKYFKVVEKSGYSVDKWLRYVTKAGKYEVQMV